MALITCPECSKQCSDKAQKCPHCGCPVVSVPAAQNTALAILQDKIQGIVRLNQISVTVEAKSKTLEIKLIRSGIKLLRPAYEQIWIKIRAQLRPDLLKGYDRMSITAKFEGSNTFEWQRQNAISPTGTLAFNNQDYLQMGVAGVVFLVFVSIGLFFFNPFRNSSSSPGLLPTLQPDIITLDEYSRLDTGTTYSQAVAIIGASGIEASKVDISGGPITISYRWQNADGSNAIIIFQDDKLNTKAQYGLK
jgi:hypothetical protein